MLRERVRKSMAVGPPDSSNHSFELDRYADDFQMDMGTSSCVSNLRKELPSLMPYLIDYLCHYLHSGRPHVRIEWCLRKASGVSEKDKSNTL